MPLDALMTRTGEWLRGTGNESDIVLSTRIRLARNLADYPFINRISPTQKLEIEAKLRDVVTSVDANNPLQYISLEGLDLIDRIFLVERQLISRELATIIEGPRGVAVDQRESIAIMINEEDQLRLQVFRSGFSLDAAWDEIDRVDDLIESKLNYAFSEQFGYLTACPTNVGTGMRASVMLHLPGLTLTHQLDKALKALSKINLVIRGVHGEGSKAVGDLYQISNQVTLGKSEIATLADLREVIIEVVRYERTARTTLVNENRQSLQDRVSRALGTLQSARMMTSEETAELLSAVRLGIHLGLITTPSIGVINELFLLSQPSHLQKLVGEPLDGEARNAARARFLRDRLRQSGGE
jgi:protein arginine kinase